MRPPGGFSGALYNKPLLRLIEFAQFLALGCAGYIYLSQSFTKLGMQGLLDALAIYSFIIAAYLLVMVAEVADAHYLRALGAFGLLVGCSVGGYFIFFRDAPFLEPAPMGLAIVTFILGLALVIAYIVLIVGRLAHGKATSARVAKVADERGAAPSTPIADALRKGLEMMKTEPQHVTTATELSLTGVSGPYLGRQFALNKGANAIGRSEGDIILEEDRQVSRKHCVIVWSEDGLIVRDVGSTNGTFVGGNRMMESSLAPGDLLMVGGSTFKIG
jgi:hypothetical protein